MIRSLVLRAAAALVCASALAMSATTAHAQVAPAPQFLLEFGAAGSGTTPLAGGHQNEQVAVDADGNVWVADKGNDRVVKFDYNGAFVTEVRTAGPGRVAFDAPEGVTADAEGFVYVADTLNDRIVKLTTGGTTAAVFATELPSANPAAEPRTPTSLAIDGAGRLYVQAAGGVIRLASADGRRLGVFTTETGTSVAVDKAGNVWTTQLTATGSQLVKFRPDGAKAGEFGSPEPIGGLNGQTARGVAVHPSGVIHVADFRGGVQRYAADGAFIDRYPADSALPPNGPLSLYIATSVAIDCRGNVYVVNADYPDTAKVTVAKFGDPAAEPPPCAPRPLPAGDIDVQVNDVEVTQGVQDLRTFTANRSPAGALAVPDYGNAASYGPTVPLAESRTTVVRAYAALRRGPAGGLANVPATLEATQRIGGVTTHRGPLAPVSQPSVLRVGGTTVDPAQRANPAGAYTFLVPTAWTRGDVDFVVQVNPSHQGCAGACQARSRFQLANVAFRRVAPVTVFPLALTIRPTNVPASYPGALPVMPGVGTLNDPGPAFDRARVLSPAPINLFPWVGRVEVGDLVRATNFVEESCFLGIEIGLLCQKENKGADRKIRQGQVMERIERWVDDNNVGDDVVTMGLISDAHPNLPGGMLRNLKDDDDTVFGYAAVHRPITAVAHELQHALGRKHAGDLASCYAADPEQVGASWPPDEQGFLQGIGLDPRLGSGGGRGPFAVLYPGANGGPGQWFDLELLRGHR